jgi:hypothetical protein
MGANDVLETRQAISSKLCDESRYPRHGRPLPPSGAQQDANAQIKAAERDASLKVPDLRARQQAIDDRPRMGGRCHK